MRLITLLSIILIPASLHAHGVGVIDIADDRVSSWAVKVTQTFHVLKGASLTITAGTEVTFDMPATDEFEPEPWILVEGRLDVAGTAGSPILFKVKSEPRQRATQDMFNILAAESAKVSYGRFIGAGWALHIHDTKTVIENSRFVDNYGGIRSSSDNLKVNKSTFAGNTIGIRLLNASGVRILSCDFIDNLTGIFLRKDILGIVITYNYFANTEYDIKLGEMQGEDISAASNWWRSPPSAGGEKLFDGNDSEGIGFVRTEPELDFEEKPES